MMTDPETTAPPAIEMLNLTKRFGSLVALDHVSMKLAAGSFHALLGGNGAGKSTLVKCLMGYYVADEGQYIVGDHQVMIRKTADARALGIGMVYQHFTLVPNMTVAENLVMSRDDVPAVVNWKKELAALDEFMSRMPFKIKLSAPVRSLAAGERQKLEILKQLYLKTKVLILDEPTSVLTPQEAEEVLGLVHAMTRRRELSVLMITHKFSQVMQFADEVTVLRLGKFAGAGKVSDLSPAVMAEMMIGSEQTTKLADRTNSAARIPKLDLTDVHADDDTGAAALEGIDLTVNAGEIVGIAGVSGNGQPELVEVLAGQRAMTRGHVKVAGEPFHARRDQINKLKIYCLPEEPLKNTCVGNMSVGQNMAFRKFDRHPHALLGMFMNGRALRREAADLIKRYRVKTPSSDTPIRNLSGGNVQRAVLARELSGHVDVMVVANPCFGLDFAAVADIRSQIMTARNRGAAVLLISEDLDEVFELSDRIVVIYDGKLVYETLAETADIRVIGRHMAGHAGA